MKNMRFRAACLILCVLLCLGVVPGRAAARADLQTVSREAAFQETETGSEPVAQESLPAAGETVSAVAEAMDSTDLPFSEYEYEVLVLLNKERLERDMHPLLGYSAIQKACNVRAKEIGSYFSHTRPSGQSCFTALEDQNILFHTAGENIAYGYRTPESVMEGWMNSKGHRANILYGGFTHVGVGFHSNGWVQMFTGVWGETLGEITVHVPKKILEGTQIDDMGMYVTIDSDIYGTCYLPITREYVSGYDRNQPGDQEVTLEFLGRKITVTLTVQIKLDAPKVSIGNGTSSGLPRLTWSTVKKAEKYRVYRSDSKSGAYSYLDTVETADSRCVFTDETAQVGKTYYYKVRAVTGQSFSPYSGVVSTRCDLKTPAVSIVANAETGKPVVQWETVEGAQKYYIYRATSKKGTYTKVKTAITARSYEDAKAKAGTQYYYKVKAVHENKDAYSAYSDPVSLLCTLPTPQMILALNSRGEPYLRWEKISGAKKYYVYRAGEDGEFTFLKSTTSVKFADKEAVSGETWTYRIKAVHTKKAANSLPSNAEMITIP